MIGSNIVLQWIVGQGSDAKKHHLKIKSGSQLNSKINVKTASNIHLPDLSDYLDMAQSHHHLLHPFDESNRSVLKLKVNLY